MVRGISLLPLGLFAFLAGCSGDSGVFGDGGRITTRTSRTSPTPAPAATQTPSPRATMSPVPTPSPSPSPTPTPCFSISFLPAVLHYSGCYRLTQDLVIQNPVGAAIRFAVSDAELDLNGHEIACEGCGASLNQVGVLSRTKSRVRVHGGRIRGFTTGVWIDDNGYDRIAVDDPAAASDILVESLDVVDNTFRGIRVEGRDTVVRACTVWGTGPGAADGSLVMGLEVYGPRPQVSDNTISETRAPLDGEGVGLSVSDWGVGAQALDNAITIAEPGAGADYGIWIGGDSDVIVARNLVDGYDTGIAFSSTTAGEYFENEVLRAMTSYYVGSGNVTGDVPP